MQINNYHYESSYNSFRTEQYVEQEDMKRFYTEKGTQESIEQERRRCIDLTV